MTLNKELRPVLWALHGGTAARLQESRAEAGVVAAPRTEAQRMAVWTEGPRGWLCREVQRTAGWTKGPRDRDWPAACRLSLSEQDFSD